MPDPPRLRRNVSHHSTRVSTRVVADLRAARDRWLEQRRGQVLSKTTILKSDHFPSGKRVFALRISGSPNYRKVPFARVYGVAQPTAWGIRAILNHLGAGRGGHRTRLHLPSYWARKAGTPQQHGHRGGGHKQKPAHKHHGGGGHGGGHGGERPPRARKRREVVWINLREEPVLYVNGRPFALRDRYDMFRNLDEYSGIRDSRLQEMEWRLKEDLVAEAAGPFAGGNVLLHEELEDKQVLPTWESVGSGGGCATPEEMFQTFRNDRQRSTVSNSGKFLVAS